MAGSWPETHPRAVMAIAVSAYGDAVAHELGAGLTRFDDPGHRRRCLNALSVNGTRALVRGLSVLRKR